MQSGSRVLAVGSQIHVRKLKPGGATDYAWDGVVVRSEGDGVVIRAEFNVELVEREFATFRRGDVFHEFYWFDRWFNVFQISAPDGTLKGWYVNLGMPPVLQIVQEAGELAYVDLALDVWANPDGSFVVLDEDELDELLREHPDLTEAAELGRQRLLELVTSGQLPRWNDDAALTE